MENRKINFLRSPNDCIIGILLTLLGLFIVFTDKITPMEITTGNGGFWARPDSYVRLMGGCMAFFSFVLILKAINWKRSKDTERVKFVLTKEIVLTIVALIVYVLLLPIIHFIPATLLACLAMTVIFYKKEANASDTEKPEKKIATRRFVVAVIYSVLLTMALFLIFKYVLNVTLP